MFSSGREAPPSYSESQSHASLTDILPTQELRTELALLLLLCTDAVRKDVVSTFELTPELASTSAASKSTSHIQDLLSIDDHQQGFVPDVEETIDRRLRREKELESSHMQGLRRASLTYFDAWRAKVMKRVCEIVNVRGETVRQARKAREAEMAATRDQKETQDLLNWANGEDGAEERLQQDAVANKRKYTAISTKLMALEKEQRVLLLNCILLLLLGLESYPAHSRILLLHVISSLQLDSPTLALHESKVAQGLLQAASQMSAEESKRKTDDSARKWKVGLATVAGAGLLAVTGGLAAPFLAAGIGTVLGGVGLAGTAVSGLLGALAGSSVLIGGLFGAYGGTMTGKIMDKYAKAVEDFRFLPVSKDKEKWEEQHKLRVAIGISGWLMDEFDIDKPWIVLNGDTCEPFALRWELETLLRLGVSLKAVIKTYIWRYAGFELARRTVFSALAAGLWPLGLLKIARVIDNPFSVGKARADKAGKVLAHALLASVQGLRPVTMIGYSLGARVISAAMLELAAQNAFGLIENVVLIGTPAPSDSETWTKMRSVVTGRVVNVYGTRDYILGLIYRASSIRIDVAGLQPIEDVNGVENFDASHLIESHDQYRLVVGQILKSIGFEDVDEVEVQAEMSTMKALKAQEQAEAKPMKDAETEAAEVEAEIEEQTGGRITMVDIDEQEEQRKEDLIRSAEENVHGHTAPGIEDHEAQMMVDIDRQEEQRKEDLIRSAEENVHGNTAPGIKDHEAQIADRMRRVHLSTQQLDLNNPQAGTTNSQRRERYPKATEEERDVHDEREGFEDEELERNMPLTFLQPEPEPDSE